jgi:hypothetical protein
MNHRPRNASPPLANWTALLLATAAFAAAAGPAMAQAPAGIPTSARTAADATPYKLNIDAFVKQQVARLADSKDPAGVKRARELLEAQVATIATPSFLSLYATSLDANVAPLSASKDLLTRLNAAIVVARVAARAQNPALQSSASKFMNDPSDAVALWGVKAAKSLIPVVLAMNGAVPDVLSPGLINVVKRHWFSGPIAYEAYDALRLNTGAAGAAGVGGPGAAQPASDAAVKAVVPHMLNLFTFRTELYAKGIPPQPTAEIAAAEFLNRTKVWPLLTEPQRAQFVQQIVSLITLAGQHANKGTAEQRWPLVETLKFVGGGLQVIGDSVKDPAMLNSGKAVRAITQATPPEVILATTAGVYKAVSGAGKVTGLKPPPTCPAPGQPLSPNEPVEEGGEATPATSGTTAGGAGASQ